ncbi:FCS-Like Zinc finger 12-like isoform X3 [Panicum virgatum]|uniref:FLZ-type domain-containing protein n=2 Tax=Panicum virgatum TaxID=38727 RepID=A0A8T0XC72_PANVG|nr:FCS-Like Zinc finger 12-like isoform X3 [Panicum virgatum]KAG2656358.1 hypothetical protein PVAP13_1KG076900 [Panicum virgatum]
MMWSHEPATEQKASLTRRMSSVARLTTASSSLANLLSVFLGASSPEPSRPRRSFDAGGGVGLGIVADMSRACLTGAEPIAIGPAARRRAREEDEFSESYTCVITHVAGAGGGSVRKRVYRGFGGGGGWLVEADDEVPAQAADFLSRCCLCDKRLDGLDIYMYRGEKAFCSLECRCHQMLMDDSAKNCGSEALRATELQMVTVSPHSAP